MSAALALALSAMSEALLLASAALLLAASIASLAVVEVEVETDTPLVPVSDGWDSYSMRGIMTSSVEVGRELGASVSILLAASTRSKAEPPEENEKESEEVGSWPPYVERLVGEAKSSRWSTDRGRAAEEEDELEEAVVWSRPPVGVSVESIISMVRKQGRRDRKSLSSSDRT